MGAKTYYPTVFQLFTVLLDKISLRWDMQIIGEKLFFTYTMQLAFFGTPGLDVVQHISYDFHVIFITHLADTQGYIRFCFPHL